MQYSILSWPQLLLYLVVLLPAISEARVWSGQELAVGEWSLTFRGRLGMNALKLFPYTTKEKSADDKNASNKQNDLVLVKRRPWGSSLCCNLSLCSDGTFVLKPTTMATTETKHDDLCDGRLAMRGRWRVYTNPYCITDRFYDQLVLTSYPRVEMGTEETPVRLKLSCRMWGKYTPSKRIGRKGKLTHGTLVEKFHGFKPIVASFTANRVSSEPTEEAWEDKEYFGY